MISRDGINKSLWQKTSSKYKTTNPAEKKTIYDVIIIGGGITGVNTALLLQQSGLKCLLLEARNLCFGTTGGTTAHLNTLLDTPYNMIEKNFSGEKAKLVSDAAHDALELIEKNIETYSIDCEHEQADAVLFSQDEKQTSELTEIVDASRRAGLNIRWTDENPVPVPFLRAAKVSGQAKFHPVKYVTGLATAFEKLGGVILQNCRALGVDENEPAIVRTTKGLYKGRSVIYATHMPTGVNLLHLRCQPFRSYAMAVTLKDKNYPEGLIYDLYDPYHYYRTQTIDGKSYLIAGGYDHKTGKEENTAGCFVQLERYLRKYFNIDKKICQWSSQYYEPADGLPYIGRLPGHSDAIYVAAGFGGNGMTYSHVAAAIFKAILHNEPLPYIDVFDPGRIKPVAGFKNFITQNAEAVKNIVSKLLKGPSVEDFSDLAPGEGRIVNYEHEKLGVFKDANGAIHAVKPTCTHLGCEVSFNNTEQSWDCPCHGARYDIDGNVLTVPSTRALEHIQINQPEEQIVESVNEKK